MGAFSDLYKGTRVARLDEAIKECLEHDMRMIIDLKDSDTKVRCKADNLMVSFEKIILVCTLVMGLRMVYLGNAITRFTIGRK